VLASPRNKGTRPALPPKGDFAKMSLDDISALPAWKQKAIEKERSAQARRDAEKALKEQKIDELRSRAKSSQSVEQSSSGGTTQ